MVTSAHPERDPPGPLRVCSSCGVIAPLERRECALCSGSLQRPLTAPPQDDDRFWVAIRSEFQCRACGKLSPINHLEVEGDATCLHCGLNQSFPAEQWRDALAHAHAVGDLAGPEPEGRRASPTLSIGAVNPLRAIGVSATHSELSLGGVTLRGAVTLSRSLRVRVSPGHPVTPRGGALLPVRRRAGPPGQPLEDIVTGYGVDEAIYSLPPAARSLAPGLCGVIASDHRSDRPPARLDLSAGDGAAALRCPSCGAPLHAPGGAHLVTCRYCSTSSKIPERTLAQLGQRPRLEMWWLAFRGPSALREILERGEAPGDMFETTEASAPIETEPPRLRAGLDPRRVLVALTVPLVALALVGWFGFADRVSAWLR